MAYNTGEKKKKQKKERSDELCLSHKPNSADDRARILTEL